MSEKINITDEKKLLGALGLCARARKLIFGVPMICEALRRGGDGPIRIVFEASDTSENTKKRISDRCRYYNIMHVKLSSDGETLASAVGKSSAIGAVAVADENMCQLVKSYLTCIE